MAEAPLPLRVNQGNGRILASMATKYDIFSDTSGLSGEQYRMILDSLSEGVCTVDLDWRITSINKQALRLMGVTGKEASETSFQALFECQLATCRELFADIMSAGKYVRETSACITNGEGERIPVVVNAGPLRNNDGNIVGLVATFRDNRPLENLRKELRNEFMYDDMVSRSPKMQRVFDILPAVAESDSSVLILGPSGTGKELLARAIHRNSPRRDKPFVAVNCGALPDNLLESELFGYKKGAFTDARTDKPGRFAMAEGGTLFLDEIGDMSPAMQVKLLRVLQERVYEPLGGVKQVPCDVRIVSATHSDLPVRVAKGEFRSDLYYRINVISFELPPLSSRTEDIPLLVKHFIETFNAEQGRAIRGISPAALAHLLQHEYTGNIRELRNIIEYAYVMCRCSEIQEQCLPPSVVNAPPAHAANVAPNPEAAVRYVNLRALPDDEERAAIEAALRDSGGKRAEAARRLGIHPSTLWRKMKRYGMYDPASPAAD